MSTDQRVVTDAQRRLMSSSHLFGQTVTCDCQDGILRLDGAVPSFYLKQKAQSLTRDVEGVQRVDNALVVINPHGISDEPAVV